MMTSILNIRPETAGGLYGGKFEEKRAIGHGVLDYSCPFGPGSSRKPGGLGKNDTFFKNSQGLAVQN